jgi:hypothetical protein
MKSEIQIQFSLTREALNTCGRAKKQLPTSKLVTRITAALLILLAAAPGCAVSGPPQPAQPVSGKAARLKRVSPEDLHLSTLNSTQTGLIHPGCVEFSDPEAVVSKGPIAKIEVYGSINGFRLFYGPDLAPGNLQGYTVLDHGITKTEWTVPEGQKITRVEGEIVGYYINRLQFFTDRGASSPQFGGHGGGRRFVVTDPANGELRTISGWANLKRSRAYNRAITSMTLHFGAPYFIKDIQYDLAALEAARLKTAPEVVATQDIENRSSLEQNSEYARELEVEKTTTLTFEQSFGLTFGYKMSGELSAGVMKASEELSLEVTASAKFGQEYKNSRREKIAWRVPVRVPPQKKIVATSTCRKYKVSIPFTYTVAWYEGTRDNIKKEVTLPGVYEDTRIEDLKHEFKEAPLD